MTPTSVYDATDHVSYCWRRWLRVALVTFLCTLAAAATGLFVLMLATPSVKDAPDRVRSFAAEHHQAYPGLPPPPRFKDALVATEDHRFYSQIDVGVDPVAILRLVSSYFTSDEQGGGGSSINQQLAKMLYTPDRSGEFAVDVKQVSLAIKFHILYSHSEILHMYATVAYFGSGYYGIEAASQGYFGRTAADLSWVQAAMLAGIVNAPSRDDPRRHPARALVRCRHVFRRLVAVGVLSSQQAATALNEPVGLVPRGE